MEQQKLIKVRDKRKKGWFYLDNEYLNGFGKYFGPIGIAVYVSLCRHADNETQQCFPSQKTIAEEISVSVKTAKKYIGLLKKHNIISIEQKRSKSGKFLHNLYTLMDKDVWDYPKGTKLPTERGGNRFHHRGEPVSITVGNQLPTKDTNKNNTNKKKTNGSSFKKPYFRGMEMRSSKGKKWVLPKDGSTWLEFTGKEEDIEYK